MCTFLPPEDQGPEGAPGTPAAGGRGGPRGPRGGRGPPAGVSGCPPGNPVWKAIGLGEAVMAVKLDPPEG